MTNENSFFLPLISNESCMKTNCSRLLSLTFFYRPQLKSRCCRRCKNPLLRRLFHPPLSPLSPLSNNKSQSKRADFLYLFTSKPLLLRLRDVCHPTLIWPGRQTPFLRTMTSLFPQTRWKITFCFRLPNARRGREFQFRSPFLLLTPRSGIPEHTRLGWELFLAEAAINALEDSGWVRDNWRTNKSYPLVSCRVARWGSYPLQWQNCNFAPRLPTSRWCEVKTGRLFLLITNTVIFNHH